MQYASDPSGWNDVADAAPAIQALVNAGLEVPPGCYKLGSQVVIPADYADRARAQGRDPKGTIGGGEAVFHLCKMTRVRCRKCGTERDWLAPDWSMRHVAVYMKCGTCFRSLHDELDGRDRDPMRHRSADGEWVDLAAMTCFRFETPEPAAS